MTAPRPRQLHLNAFLMNAGHHDAAWRHPRTQPERVTDLRYFQQLARTAERGLLDSVFLADGLALWGKVRYNALGGFEPLTLLSALAAVTEHVGLIATVSTTFNEPFHTARKFASLDHISGGRAGWNIVTSGTVNEARNFGQDEHLEHALRYERAREFVEVATKLWDSWEDDAILLDRERGVYADTDKVREINHRGEYFGVQGPLNVPRSPQGYPLLVQAGSSEDGKEFAAQYAEAVFTAQQTLADGQAFHKDLKSRLARYGRTGDQLLVLPGIAPVIGSTEAEARALEQELTDLQVPEYGLAQLSGMLGTDLTGLPLDGPLPELPKELDINGNKSRFTLVAELARRDGLTLRELIARLGAGRGHRVFAGTPEQIADEIEEWFTEGAADGFNIMPPHLPGGLEDFVDHVVPILQRRGLFRTEYTGRTLRENHGLTRPANRLAATAAGEEDRVLLVRDLLPRGRHGPGGCDQPGRPVRDRAGAAQREGVLPPRPGGRGGPAGDAAGPAHLLPHLRPARHRPLHPALRRHAPHRGHRARHRRHPHRRRRLLHHRPRTVRGRRRGDP